MSTTGKKSASALTSSSAGSLLLARIAENACGGTWPNLRRELDRIHASTFTGPAALPAAHEITKPARHLHA